MIFEAHVTERLEKLETQVAELKAALDAKSKLVQVIDSLNCLDSGFVEVEPVKEPVKAAQKVVEVKPGKIGNPVSGG